MEMRSQTIRQGKLSGRSGNSCGKYRFHDDRVKNQKASGKTDNDQVLVEYESGATGIYWTSQFAIGCDNSLRIRIFGSKGTISWFQEEPEQIILIREDGIQQVIKRGYGVIPEQVAKYGRLPAGHTEGWIEAMGNLYDNFTDCLQAKKEGKFNPSMIDFQTIDAGVEGLEFIEACLESNGNGNKWVTL